MEQIIIYWLIKSAILVTSIILPSFAIWWLTQRSKYTTFFHSLNGVAPNFMSVIGLVFGLNIAFLSNEVWITREAAKVGMSYESQSLRNITRVSTSIPDLGGLAIIEAVKNYLEAVVSADNRAVTKDNSSLPALIKLSDAILNRENMEKVYPSFRQMLLAELKIVRDRSIERTAFIQTKPNKTKWLLVILLESVTLITIAVCHITTGRALVVASFLFLSSVNTYLMVLYSTQSPFSGLDRLNNSAFIKALDRVKSMEEVYKEKAAKKNN